MSLLRITLALLIAITGGFALGSPTARAASPSPAPAVHDVTHPRIMQEAAQKEAAAPHRTYAPVGGPAPQQAFGTSGRLNHEVFGFAYGSSLGDPTIGYPSWDFSLLSTVAYFGIHVSFDGGFIGDSSWSTWDDPNGPVPGLISVAHANNVKVVMTVILQDFDSQNGTPLMCSGLVNYQTTITQILNQVHLKPIDGINLDYEGLNGNCYDTKTKQVESLQWMLTRFVRALRQALPSTQYLSIDTYSGSAGDRSGTTYYGFFDIGALSQLVDAFFVMTYDMEYSNYQYPPLNCASFCLGPTSPLTTYFYNDTRAISDYTQVVPASKMLLGIPYYGRKECVTSGTPSTAPANAFPISNTVAADGYLDASTENGYFANSDYHGHRDGNDPAGSERWDTWSSSTLNCTREMYWDDVVSLGNKYNLINSTAIRGAGIWTLSYGGGASELWNLIAAKFAACTSLGLNVSPPSPQAPGTGITFTGSAGGCAGPQYKFFVQPPGSSTWQLGRDYSATPSWTWATTGLATGFYRVAVWVRASGSPVDYELYTSSPYTLTVPCASASLSGNPASPQPPGTSVIFTAAATGCPQPSFQFYAQGPNSNTWTQVQGYSPSSTWTMNTTGWIGGNYHLAVWVKDAGSTASYDTYTIVPYTLWVPCTGISLGSSLGSPQAPGPGVTFTASATGCPQAQYRFWLQAPGSSTWQIVQDYSTSAGWTWNTSGQPTGPYKVAVWARALGSSVSYDVYTSVPFSLNAPCSSVQLSAAPASPATPGASVTFTAAAATCPTPRYKFWLLAPGSSTWQMTQDYSPTATWTWSSTTEGAYQVAVWAVDSGSSAAYDAYTSISYSLPACGAVSLASSPGSAAPAGTSVTFTAAAAGCPQAQYRFWLQAPGSTTWQIVQDYGSSATWTWPTTGLARGSYRVAVWARASGSTAAYEAYTSVPYQLT